MPPFLAALCYGVVWSLEGTRVVEASDSSPYGRR